jgi:Ca2+-binding RTX toxin-like protein
MCVNCGFENVSNTSSFLHEAGAVSDANLVVGYTPPVPLPIFNTGQIVQALRTSWLGPVNGNGDYPTDPTTRWWYASATFNGEITYRFDQNRTIDYGNGATTVRGAMSAIEQARITEALEIWDDFIGINIRQDNASAFEIFFATGGTGTISPGNAGDTSGRAFAAVYDSERNVNNIYGTEDNGIYRVDLNLGRGFSGGEMDGLNAAGVADGGAFDFSYGQRGFETLLHEIGHSLGLSHAGFYNAGAVSTANGALFAQDNRQNSIMSYFGEGPNANWQGVNASTPMVYDILAVQTIYGADSLTRNTATTYGFNNTSGRDAFAFSTTRASVFAIWDGGGIDTLDASLCATSARIDLTPGSYSNIGQANGNTGAAMIGNVGIAFNCIIENAVGTALPDVITGNAVGNILTGGAGGDTLNGGGGNDTLYANSSTALPTAGIFDRLFGGTGSDKLHGTRDTEFYGEAGFDEVFLRGEMTSAQIINMFVQGWLDGGADQDTLWLNQIQRSSADILTGTGFTLNILDGSFEVGRGSAGGDVLGGRTLPPFVNELNPKSYSLYGEAGNDTLHGNGAINYLEGGVGNDKLYGEGGDDRLIAGSGDDELRGGAGTDVLAGEAGDDVIYFDYADTLSSINQQVVFINGGSGYDFAIVEGPQGVVLNLAVSEFEEAFGGVGDDTFNATNANWSVTMDGRGGSDTLQGGIFNDFFIDTGADNGDNFVGNLGTDTVSYVWYQGGVEIDFDHYDVGYGRVTGLDSDIGIDQLLEIENIIGGNGNDLILGGSGNTANMFDGENGDDQLFGGSGSDVLKGGTGADSLYGEDGEDTFFGGLGNDHIEGGANYDALSYAGENARIVLNIAAGGGTATGAGIGTDSFSEIELYVLGNGGDSVRTSGASETVDMGSGDDTLFGSIGEDLYVGGLGIDTLDYSASVRGLYMDPDFVEDSFGELDFVGGFENMFGGSAADQIYGSAIANILKGNGGADLLDGQQGNDDLNGGLGDDTLAGGAGGDVLNGGSGLHDVADYADSDTAVTVSIGGVPAATGGHSTGDTFVGIEDLTGSAFGDALAGNSFQNVLRGGAGADSLNSSTNNDQVYGGSGDDLLVGGRGADVIDGGADNDTVSYANSDGRIILTLVNGAGTATGSGHGAGDTITNVENITGSAFNDIITGDANANTILGGAGNDTLNGDGGADIINGQGGLDRINGGAGFDTLSGGADLDTFVYNIAALWDADYILGFNTNLDKIDLVGAGFDFGDFTESQDGGDTLLTLTANAAHSIRLVGINANTIDATDFV